MCCFHCSKYVCFELDSSIRHFCCSSTSTFASLCLPPSVSRSSLFVYILLSHVNLLPPSPSLPSAPSTLFSSCQSLSRSLCSVCLRFSLSVSTSFCQSLTFSSSSLSLVFVFSRSRSPTPCLSLSLCVSLRQPRCVSRTFPG